MIRSLSILRRGLLSLTVAGALGFGATQALASPQTGPGPGDPYCPIDDAGPYYSAYCARGCAEGIGYCGLDGRCHCGSF